MSTPAAGLPQEQTSSSLLLVDDEPYILSALQRLLRPLGYRIFTATGGAAGLEILERERIDLIISDMRMPEMDGAQFLAQVAKRWPDTLRILLTGYADLPSAIAAINQGRIYCYVSKPWGDNDLKLIIARALEHLHTQREKEHLEALTRAQNEELKALNASLEEKVRARTAELEQVMQMLEASYASLKKGYSATIRVFSHLIEARDPASSGHGQRVAETAEALARALGLHEPEVQDVVFAAQLHDLGKIALSDALLHKPFHLLVPEERAHVARHPVVGQTLLMALEPLGEAARLIRAHHERYDGAGYPDRLAGDAIPLGARILAVAEDYDELQMGLVTPERLSSTEAAAFIREGRGRRYDPTAVEAFLEWWKQRPADAKGSGERRYRPGGLKPGMRLARDLVTHTGMLLLPRGTELTAAHLERLRALERTMGWQVEVYVQVNAP